MLSCLTPVLALEACARSGLAHPWLSAMTERAQARRCGRPGLTAPAFSNQHHPRGRQLADETKTHTIDDLLDVMAALRTPGTGCPWDLQQTFATIAPYTIEEAYEVADAIARENSEDLKDELGDLLLQVVYHARMAEEAGRFAFGDVADAIVTKMIRRHPHVFGDADARAQGAAPGFWERIKAQEKAEKDKQNAGDLSERTLSDVPLALPALTRAVKLQSKAAKVGFDWPSLAPVFEKMREELAELEMAIQQSCHARGVTGDANSNQSDTRSDAVEEEFGDLLFVMANVARHLNCDPEAALRRANHKFVSRFAYIEDRLRADGRSPEQSTLDEMDQLWDAAKRDRIGDGDPDTR